MKISNLKQVKISKIEIKVYIESEEVSEELFERRDAFDFLEAEAALADMGRHYEKFIKEDGDRLPEDNEASREQTNG